MNQGKGFSVGVGYTVVEPNIIFVIAGVELNSILNSNVGTESVIVAKQKTGVHAASES